MQNNSIKIYMTSNVIDIFLWIAYRFEVRVRVMVFNAIFNNISEFPCRSVLLVEETEVPGKNHRPIASH